MAVEWCQPCRARGKLSIARHDVACTLMCDDCFAGRASRGISVALLKREPEKKVEEKKAMAIRLDDATKEAIRKDAEGGMSLADISKKHSVSWPTAKQYAGVVNGQKSVVIYWDGRLPFEGRIIHWDFERRRTE
jgi:hypothetical protein